MSNRKVHFDRIAEQKTSFPNLISLVPGYTFCLRVKTPRTLETKNPGEVTCKSCKNTSVLIWNPVTRTHEATKPCG